MVYPWTGPITTRGAETVSPHGNWKAFVEDFVDAPGPLGGAEVLQTVYVESSNHPDEVVRILTIDTDGHAEAMPRLAWTAPGVLQITLNNRFPATIDRHAYKGVRIDLRFEPDDARARETWMKAEDAPAR
jgi:hypothetical protein